MNTAKETLDQVSEFERLKNDIKFLYRIATIEGLSIAVMALYGILKDFIR